MNPERPTKKQSTEHMPSYGMDTINIAVTAINNEVYSDAEHFFNSENLHRSFSSAVNHVFLFLFIYLFVCLFVCLFVFGQIQAIICAFSVKSGWSYNQTC